VCLSTLDNQAESVDYFLTQPAEPIANFLSFTRPLKVCYVSTREKCEEKVKKQSVYVVIQDFDFIKVLGKGGFATVYMGK
jgi:transcription antitermination factor NusA-like protein